MVPRIFTKNAVKLISCCGLAVILLCGLHRASARSMQDSLSIDLQGKKMTIAQIFHALNQQTGFIVFYNNHILNDQERLDVNFEHAGLRQVLDYVVKGKMLTYVIRNRFILLQKEKAQNGSPQVYPSEPAASAATADIDTLVTGTIKSETGEPLVGVSVRLKDTRLGSVTDASGHYSVRVPNLKGSLVLTYVGYDGQVVPISGRMKVDIVMKASVSSLDQLVIVGYGTQKKADLTGSVATVNADDVTKVMSTNLGQAIEGRMAGVQVTQSSGQPGAGAAIKVRGVGSVKSGNSPLILVDGFIGSMDDIDADNVASVTVLKDAAAAAIYGARAANGVILVTTKTGTVGKARVEFKAEYGFQTLTKSPNYLDGPTWAMHQNEARLYNGESPYWVGDHAPETIKKWTDWKDYVFRTAPVQDYHMGVYGGSEDTKYAVSLGYISQTGTIIGTDFNRINARVNFSQRLGKRFRVGMDMSYIRSRYNTTITPFSSSEPAALNGITAAPPTIPAYNPDGLPGSPRQGYPGEAFIVNTTWKTPSIANEILDNLNRVNRTVGNVFAEADLVDGLKYRLAFNGSVNNDYAQHWESKWAIYAPEDLAHTNPLAGNAAASLQDQATENYVWEIQNLITYQKRFGLHDIHALFGFSEEKGGGNLFNATKQGFPNNELRVIGVGNTMLNIGGSLSEYSLISQFGRINYAYHDKYLFQANARRDGSSVFAPGKHYGVFPSFSAGWRLSQESFMKSITPISDLKIRASWGQLGNANIPSYAWISKINVNGGAVMGEAQDRVPAYYTTQMTNENVKWETTTTTDIGIDLSLFSGRLNFTGDWYDKRTHDMLLDATIPFSAGYSTGPVVNLGEVQNKGWEVMLNYKDHIGQLNFDAVFNLSHNQNKVVSLGGINPWVTSCLIVKEGLPLYAYWGWVADGIWKTKKEIDGNAHRPGDIRPGMVRYKDINNDGVIDEKDKTMIGNYMPKYVYGFGLNVSYKGIDLSVFFQGEAQKDMLVESVFGGNGEGENNNIDRYYWDNRAILGDNKDVISGTTPAAGAVKGDMSWSSFLVQDASYLRIKNFQLGYTFGSKSMTALKIQSCRIYLNATNPVLWTKYIGYDPEMTPSEPSGINVYSRGGVDTYPVSKSIAMGIRIVF